MRNFRCATCKAVVTDPYAAFDHRIELRRVQGAKRDSVIQVARICLTCKDKLVGQYRPEVDHQQASML